MRRVDFAMLCDLECSRLEIRNIRTRNPQSEAAFESSRPILRCNAGVRRFIDGLLAFAQS